MHVLKTIALCAAALVGLAGCEGENLFANGDVVLVDETDTYDAVQFDLENRAGERIDVIDDGGRFTLTLDEEADEFESDFVFRGVSVRTSGTFRVADGRITFSDDPFTDNEREFERSFDFARTENVIVLEDTGALFDVDNDGNEEVVALLIRLERRGG